MDSGRRAHPGTLELEVPAPGRLSTAFANLGIYTGAVAATTILFGAAYGPFFLGVALAGFVAYFESLPTVLLSVAAITLLPKPWPQARKRGCAIAISVGAIGGWTSAVMAWGGGAEALPTYLPPVLVATAGFGMTARLPEDDRPLDTEPATRSASGRLPGRARRRGRSGRPTAGP